MMSAEKDNGRAVTTPNYSYLESSVKNEREALIVAEVTSYPHDLVARCGVLLWEVMQSISFKVMISRGLICALHLGGKTLIAELSSIHEQLMIAEKMLEECQYYNEIFKGGTDNDERARAEHKN